MNKKMKALFCIPMSLAAGKVVWADNSAQGIKTEVTTARPANLILEPEYTEQNHQKKEADSQEPPAQKLQYEPVTSDTPLLKEREANVEQSSGAEYEKGTDLFIAPEPDSLVKEEAIEEITEQNPVSPSEKPKSVTPPCECDVKPKPR
jgi:hypothetical protein